MLKNKVGLVTGASSGIGRAVALVWAREGARMVVSDVQIAAGEETAAMVRAQGGDAVFFAADVGEPDDSRALVEHVLTHYGRLDIACNNAGIGHGAISAIDYHAEVTTFVNSKAMQKALREVADYGEHGYYWKRETCAKLAKLGCKDVLLDHKDSQGNTGWKIGPAGIALLNKFCKE